VKTYGGGGINLWIMKALTFCNLRAFFAGNG